MTQPGERHFTVSVYIFSKQDEPQVLLLFHKKLQKWMQPGGHIEPFENPVEAAIREVREETGIDIESYLGSAKHLTDGVLQLPSPISLQQQPIPAHGDDPAHYHLDLGYVVKMPHSVPAPMVGESDMINWFTERQLDQIVMFDNVKALIKELFAGLSK